MTKSCPRIDEISRLLDGELTRNEESAARAHLSTCGDCRAEEERLKQLFGDIAAEIPGLVAADATQKVMDRIRAGDLPQAETKRRISRRWLGVGGGMGLCAAAALAILVGVRAPSDSDGFQARGGAQVASLEKNVGVTLYAPLAAHAPLKNGATVDKSAAYTAAYRNLERDGAVELLVFAVDAGGEIHWLYPAYTSRDTDPVSLHLPYAAEEIPLAESVVLEDVAPGKLRFFTVLSRLPVHVSSIETLKAEQLSRDALRARFSGARVDELWVSVVAGEKTAPSIGDGTGTR